MSVSFDYTRNDFEAVAHHITDRKKTGCACLRGGGFRVQWPVGQLAQWRGGDG